MTSTKNVLIVKNYAQINNLYLNNSSNIIATEKILCNLIKKG